MLTPKYLTTKETHPNVDDPFGDMYFLQDHLIEETQTLVSRCYDPEKADLINFDAFQAISFLIITDQHIDLGKVELQNCLDLLGIHPVVLQDVMRILKRIYHIPKNTDLLSFIRHIGPILLEKNESREFEWSHECIFFSNHQKDDCAF